MADILQVVNRISELKGVSKEKLEEIRVKKEHERGGFSKNLFLIDSSDTEKNWNGLVLFSYVFAEREFVK